MRYMFAMTAGLSIALALGGSPAFAGHARADRDAVLQQQLNDEQQQECMQQQQVLQQQKWQPQIQQQQQQAQQQQQLELSLGVSGVQPYCISYGTCPK